MAKFSVSFSGAVFDVDVDVGGHVVKLARRGDKWTGSKEITAIGASIRIEAKIIALTHTDWSLTVKKGSKKIMEESGTTDSTAVSLNQVVVI